MKPKALKIQQLLLSLFYKITVLLGIQLPPLPSASAIITNKKKEILVVNLSYKKGYALPGGLLKPNETFSEAVIREVLEETGLDIVKPSFVSFYTANDQFPTINALYLADIKSGILSNSFEGKVSWQNPKKIIDKIAYKDNKKAIIDFIDEKKNT